MPEDILTAIEDALPKGAHVAATQKLSAVQRVVDYIERNYSKDITLDELAGVACLSKNYFCSVFSLENGQTPMEYLTTYRIQVAQQLIASTSLPLNEIAIASGIHDYARFCKTFKRVTGHSPGAHRKAIT